MGASRLYIKSATIENFRTFERLTWSLGEVTRPGWHVVLGPNGAGKSSFLRALSLALIGPNQAQGTRLDFSQLVRVGSKTATISVELEGGAGFDSWSGSGLTPRDPKIVAGIEFEGGDAIKPARNSNHADRTVWGGKEKGWFSAGFGPFRRFSGGNPEYIRLYNSHPKLARHLSIFGEDVALTEALEWLKQLRFRELESSPSGRSFLKLVQDFVNQEGFLPFGARLLEINSRDVVFVDGNGTEIPVLDMSDGYRSILSMIFELIRLIHDAYGESVVFAGDGATIAVPGVVLIDEVDVHLHPNWQRTLGPWLCKHFPNVQFIVTTHSSFICQQAAAGSVWRLPDPGSGQDLKRVEGEELTRLLYGDATLALETPAFGVLQNRSELGEALLAELAELNMRAHHGGLDAKQAKRRAHLQAALLPVLPA